MEDYPEIHFERDTDWYDWLLNNYNKANGVYLIFYKLELNIPTMRWEEAVKVALCFGWIDSKVQSLGNGKRCQYFSPRNPKGNWSALNKKYVKDLITNGLMHEAGYKMIDLAKQTGTWTAMDDVENGVIPIDLQQAFDKNKSAFKNYQNFARGYRKGYLSWLHSAKREETRKSRIIQIIELCANNIKSRNTKSSNKK
ncbi:MAG: YdeI/OmpD-associated family protein [Algibacter sp.]|uniref:YdeI/OmpD-associated family protein n=1 Tax=Algibacter sp. TaxID=1872428 RepID=UPI0026301626|nr:YdeI/OmpD-associated family protein [Algibacter sp.]MDG1729192.1 YdeI/OmpD-associated family protein [Algibacter sp.]MDG2178449.1 YdeI/OmpD-associated family protein [Algibacter sp.]